MKTLLLELSHRHKLGHLTSNLTTLPILDRIFPTLRDEDMVIISSGHAGLALYCALQKYREIRAEELLEAHGVQPHLDPPRGIHCSTGSLGQGLTVAVGYALARPSCVVHCIISDGECAEGCVWEALAFARLHHLDNLLVHVNINGRAAIGTVDVNYLVERLRAFLPGIKMHFTHNETLSFLHGIHGHYKSMTDAEYQSTV